MHFPTKASLKYIEKTPDNFSQCLPIKHEKKVRLPLAGIEPATPGLQDQCCATELKRPKFIDGRIQL